MTLSTQSLLDIMSSDTGRLEGGEVIRQKQLPRGGRLGSGPSGELTFKQAGRKETRPRPGGGPERSAHEDSAGPVGGWVWPGPGGLPGSVGRGIALLLRVRKWRHSSIFRYPRWRGGRTPRPGARV